MVRSDNKQARRRLEMNKPDQNTDTFLSMSGSSPPTDTSQNASQWMNTTQAAKYLGLSKKTIYNLRSQGELLGKRMAGKGKLVFRKEDLDAWVEGKANPKSA